jgi:hypothetical protein
MNKNVVPAVVNSEKEVSKNKRRRKNLYKNDVLFQSWGWIVPCC